MTEMFDEVDQIEGVTVISPYSPQGQVLGQLQYLINRMIFQADREHPKVALDVGGYRTKVREQLTARAREAVDADYDILAIRNQSVSYRRGS